MGVLGMTGGGGEEEPPKRPSESYGAIFPCLQQQGQLHFTQD